MQSAREKFLDSVRVVAEAHHKAGARTYTMTPAEVDCLSEDLGRPATERDVASFEGAVRSAMLVWERTGGTGRSGLSSIEEHDLRQALRHRYVEGRTVPRERLVRAGYLQRRTSNRSGSREVLQYVPTRAAVEALGPEVLGYR